MSTSEIKKEARTLLKGNWNKLAIITFLYFFSIFLFSFLISLIVQWLHLPILELGIYVVSIPLGFGYWACIVKTLRGEQTSYLHFFEEGFSSFSKVWGVFGNVLLKFIVPIVLIIIFMIFSISGISFTAVNSIFSSQFSNVSLVISIIGSIGLIVTMIYCIPKAFLYYLSYFVLYDNPEMKGKEIVEESARLMMDYRWKLFYLALTFIGWALLASLGYIFIFAFLSIITFFSWLALFISIIALYIAISYVMVYLMSSIYVFYEHRKNANLEPEIINETNEKEEL